ncbi:MAG TPA: hypothetical protein VFV07_05645 [Rhizomicrobium sp.]|nr:hypothetical protein [Rhizomicrobium sp.]
MRIRNTMMLALGVSGLVLASSAADARKAQLIPVILFPGATTTTVFGITDDGGTIGGSYVSSADGNSHGFYGTIDGNYVSFDLSGQTSTQGRAISGDGKWMTGFSNITDVHCNFPEWELKIGGSAQQITKNGTPLFGEAQGLNKDDQFAGDYCDTGGSGTIFGQLGKKGKWKSDVTGSFTSAYTGERGVNGAGMVVGFYVNGGTGLQIGTIIQGGSTTQVIDPGPNENYTVLEGVNDDGLASGQWQDTSGIVHSFSYNAGTFTEIDDPNAASFTQAWGVNKKGLIAVTSDAGPYIYCDLKPSKCPSTGAAPIEIDVKTMHVSPAEMRLLILAKKGHPTAKLNLPKGAALQ